jgi:hypothetical protein
MARRGRKRKSKFCRQIKANVTVKVNGRYFKVRDDSVVKICPVGKGYKLLGSSGIVGKALRKA